MRNRFSGICCICGKEVPPKNGYFQLKYRTIPKELQHKIIGKWLCRCVDCVNKGNKQLIDKLMSKNGDKYEDKI
jgi:hypothetical protein